MPYQYVNAQTFRPKKRNTPLRGRIWYAPQTSGLPTQRYEKLAYFCYVETRAENSEQHYSVNTGLPKWWLKANWIVRQYARIWCLQDNLLSINFEVAFRDVFVQLFLDEGLLEKDAESCITFAYNEFRLQHRCLPYFPTKAKKWEWIIENGLFLFLKHKFLSNKAIQDALYVADYTERTIGVVGEHRIFSFHGPWIDYEYYLAAPCLPPYGHEWVDDPWAQLGK